MTSRHFLSAVITLGWLLASPGLSYADGKFMTSRGSSVIIVTDRGSISVQDTPSSPPKTYRLPLKGRVISIAANSTGCFGVTDAGEIFSSRDCRSWSVIDFNEEYRDYYGHVNFVGIAACAQGVAVAGSFEGGAPAVFTSTRGTVWSARGLTYSQGENLFELTETPLSIAADVAKDEYILTCTDGVKFYLPPCTHCNRLEYYGDL